MFETVDKETNKVNGLGTTHGYFKLKEKSMKLDLRRDYEKARVKWLYFTAIKPKNPQHRAWFHAIRGPAFGQPRLHARLLPLKHCVVATTIKGNTIIPETIITPTSVESGNLDFELGKASQEHVHDIYVYSMQVCPLQQDLTTESVCDKIKESSDLIPPRILQSVHGFFKLKDDHPTRLNLSASWDKNTVKGQVLFYFVDAEDGIPKPLEEPEKPTLFGKKK